MILLPILTVFVLVPDDSFNLIVVLYQPNCITACNLAELLNASMSTLHLIDKTKHFGYPFKENIPGIPSLSHLHYKKLRDLIVKDHLQVLQLTNLYLYVLWLVSASVV